MKNKPLKIILNVLVIVSVLGIVLYYSLKDNYQEILTTIFNMNKLYFLLAIIVLCLYRLIASIAYYNIVKINNEDVSFLKCFQINFIILFFHGVTPFAGGGQPMEIYYLHKEKVPIPKATNIVLQNFIVYQIALVTVGIMSLIYNYFFHLFPTDHFVKHLVIVGFLINTLVLLASFIISFSHKFQEILIKLINKLTNILAKFKLIKDKDKIKNKVQEYISGFHDNASYLTKDKKLIFKLVLLNILSLCILYSMPYILAKGMHLNIKLLDAITATSYVMIIGSFVPIPGGTGGIEYSFVFFYNYLMKGHVINALMLVWRFISYYLGMIFGGIALSLYRKRSKNENRNIH